MSVSVDSPAADLKPQLCYSFSLSGNLSLIPDP